MPGTRYRVTVDKAACDGIFACLTRDPRFVEDEDGLATVEPADARLGAGETTQQIHAEFEDENLEDARAAAAACPPDAITVEVLEEASTKTEEPR